MIFLAFLKRWVSVSLFVLLALTGSWVVACGLIWLFEAVHPVVAMSVAVLLFTAMIAAVELASGRA